MFCLPHLVSNTFLSIIHIVNARRYMLSTGHDYGERNRQKINVNLLGFFCFKFICGIVLERIYESWTVIQTILKIIL